MTFNKKYLRYLLSFLCFGLLVLASNVSAQGRLGSTHVQKFVIVKYGLKTGTSGFVQSQTVNDGEEINNIPVDSDGSQLSPMEGIHYLIQKVSAVNGKSGNEINLSRPDSYQKIGNAAELVTNSSGLASMNLSDGFYVVTELANSAAHLSKPAKAVLIRLPVVNSAKTGYLTTVYLYPKSSIDTKENLSSSKTKTKVSSKKLPKTGSASSVGLTIIGVLFLSLALAFVLKFRKETRCSE